MPNLPTRRGFLALSGTGAAASLAGCSQLESITQGDSGNADGPLTVTVSPDREQLASLEQELRRSVQSGNISEQQASQRFQKRQRELTEEAATAVEELANNNDDVSIEKSSASYGFFLVDAPAETLVTALQNGDIGAIYPEERYAQFAQQRDQLRQRRQAARDGQQGTTNESNASTDGANETNESASGANETNDSSAS